MRFTEEQLARLRQAVQTSMSEKRFRHTAEVEKMAVRLGLLYAPSRIDALRAAALLHDITKEYSVEEHMRICREFGIRISKQDILTPKTFHAKTAAAVIPTRYPEFAVADVIAAVRWHTTGRREMRLLEKIIYLADYIDESRTFPDCIALRQMFWEAAPQRMSKKQRAEHLDHVILHSLNMTVAALMEEGAPIAEDTVSARNRLIERLS